MFKTKQEIFDAVCKGLAAQGFQRSVSRAFAVCRYRGEGGRKCAIGHLIPDDKYSIELEGGGVTFVPVRMAAGIPPEFEAFAFDLQEAHDISSSPESMKNLLRQVAVNHDLKTPDSLEAK